jgi:hypothetical protein
MLLLLLDDWLVGRFRRAAVLPTGTAGAARQSFWHVLIEKLPLSAIADGVEIDSCMVGRIGFANRLGSLASRRCEARE